MTINETDILTLTDDIIGWSRASVKDYQKLNDSIGAQILELCKNNQKGRAPQKGANAPFNFTEGWFRNSGLYDLNEYCQKKIIDRFISDKCNWNKSKLQREASKYKLWMDMEDTAESNLHDRSFLKDIVEMIHNGIFHSMEQLKRKVESFLRANPPSPKKPIMSFEARSICGMRFRIKPGGVHIVDTWQLISWNPKEG